MRGIIQVTVRLIQAGRRTYERKWSFLGVFAVAFLGSIVVLGKLDLLPSAAPVLVASAVAPSVTLSPIVTELPLKIEIPKLNRSVDIMNPTTTVIAALDKELLKGAVRYPTSAKLGEVGNVVLFGHSSYLPVLLVHNQAYKAFNNIQKLVAGDSVTVYSSGTAYTYRVRSVTRESMNRDGIPLSVSGKILTLVTCDRSLGEATDRSVVVADFVESHSISS